MRIKIKLAVVLLAMSCNEVEFDRKLKETQPAGDTEDATANVDPSPTPLINPPNKDEDNREKETFNPAIDRGLLDLLLVIDDSKSMKIVRNTLKDRLEDLLKHIDNSNWQIKVVDVDASNICEHTIITKNNEEEWAKLLSTFSANPNSNERTLQKAQAALGLQAMNKDHNCPKWLRDGSTLAAVIITDEDSQCTNPDADDNNLEDDNSFRCDNLVEDFITSFKGLRTETEPKLYGIFDTEKNCGDIRTSTYIDKDCYLKEDADTFCWFTNPCYGRDDLYKFRSANYLAHQDQPPKFDHVLHLGATDEEYATFLQSISAKIKDILQDQYTLKKEPDTTKEIKVTVGEDTKTLDTDFTIAGRILTFITEAPKAPITVEYVPKGT